ncbi:hypothetical protein C8R45DRAFT_1084404 [Mycena sanguinolenta]|nr:hypothetical protein C8R45DRAFT_1084404 [Mycena sanguinolenta]
MQKCLTGKNRQECTHISLAKENSASPGPPEEKETAMVTRGLRTTALSKKTIERNTGLQWDKPPRKATWSWSHPAPHALLATRVDLHKLSIGGLAQLTDSDSGGFRAVSFLSCEVYLAHLRLKYSRDLRGTQRKNRRLRVLCTSSTTQHDNASVHRMTRAPARCEGRWGDRYRVHPSLYTMVCTGSRSGAASNPTGLVSVMIRRRDAGKRRVGAVGVYANRVAYGPQQARREGDERAGHLLAVRDFGVRRKANVTRLVTARVLPSAPRVVVETADCDFLLRAGANEPTVLLPVLFPVLFYTTMYITDICYRTVDLSASSSPIPVTNGTPSPVGANIVANNTGGTTEYPPSLSLARAHHRPACRRCLPAQRDSAHHRRSGTKRRRGRGPRRTDAPQRTCTASFGCAGIGGECVVGAENKTAQERRVATKGNDGNKESGFTHSVADATLVIACTGFSWGVTQWAPFSLLAGAILTSPGPGSSAARGPGGIRLEDARTRNEEEEGFLVVDPDEMDGDDDEEDEGGARKRTRGRMGMIAGTRSSSCGQQRERAQGQQRPRQPPRTSSINGSGNLLLSNPRAQLTIVDVLALRDPNAWREGEYDRTPLSSADVERGMGGGSRGRRRGLGRGCGRGR